MSAGVCIGCIFSKKTVIDGLRHLTLRQKSHSFPCERLSSTAAHSYGLTSREGISFPISIPRVPLAKASGYPNWSIHPSLTSHTVILSHMMIGGAAFKKYPLCLSPHDLQVLRTQAYNLCSQLACSLGLVLHQLSLFLGLKVKSRSQQQRQTTPKEKVLTCLFIPVFVKLHEGSIKNQKPTNFQSLEYFQDSVLLQPSWFFPPSFSFLVPCYLREFICLRVPPCTSLSLCHYYPPCRNSYIGGL